MRADISILEQAGNLIRITVRVFITQISDHTDHAHSHTSKKFTYKPQSRINVGFMPFAGKCPTVYINRMIMVNLPAKYSKPIEHYSTN